MSEEKRSLVGRGGQMVGADGGGGGQRRSDYGGTDNVALAHDDSGNFGKRNGAADHPPPYMVEASGQISPRSFDQSNGFTHSGLNGAGAIAKKGSDGPGLLGSDNSLSNPSRIHFDGSTDCSYADPSEGLDKSARNRLLIATSICMVFMIGEIVAGVLSNSLAIISDGVHLLTDFASFLIAMSALHLAQRPASNKLNFGWHRIEILGACLSILLLWVLTGILCYSATQRIINQDYEIEPKILLIAASIGVFFNIVLATVLNEDLDALLGRGEDGEDDKEDEEKAAVAGSSGLETSRSSTDGLSVKAYQEKQRKVRLAHIETGRIRKKPGNINVKAAYLHVLGDLVQSLGILTSALIIFFKPEWKIADPCCTFFFSFIVWMTTMTIMKDIVVVLMEAAPKEADVAGMKTDILNIPGVVGIHSYRVWSLTLDKMAVSAHISIAPDADPFQVLDDATYVVRELHFAHESYIQLKLGRTHLNKESD